MLACVLQHCCCVHFPTLPIVIVLFTRNGMCSHAYNRPEVYHWTLLFMFRHLYLDYGHCLCVLHASSSRQARARKRGVRLSASECVKKRSSKPKKMLKCDEQNCCQPYVIRQAVLCIVSYPLVLCVPALSLLRFAGAFLVVSEPSLRFTVPCKGSHKFLLSGDCRFCTVCDCPADAYCALRL